MDIRSKEKGLVRKPGKGQGWWGMDMDFKGFGEFGGLDENWWLEEGKGCGRGHP